MRLLVLSILVLVRNLQADTPADPIPLVTASASGSLFFKMVPPKGHVENDKYVLDRQPFGVAYRVDEDGRLIELWRTQGWYTFQAFLSNDGHFLVRMGPWSEGKEASVEDLAIAFYQDGKLLKDYSTADLLKDKSAVRRTVSHYRWRAPEFINISPGDNVQVPDTELKLDDDGIIKLRTSEGTLIQFDSKTGDILGRIESTEYCELLRRYWIR